MFSIFLSYRRNEDGLLVERVRDFLQHVVDVSVSDDVSSENEPVQQIDAIMAKTDIVLVFVGSEWSGIDALTGDRLLDNPLDGVRIEIASALRRGIPVVPVLLDRPSMPGRDELPDDLKPLSNIPALRIDSDQFDASLAEMWVTVALLAASQGIVESSHSASVYSSPDAIESRAVHNPSEAKAVDVEWPAPPTLSGFAPKTVGPDSRVLVQAYVHLPLHTEAVRKMARERDPLTSRAGSQSLGVQLTSGMRVRLRLEAENLEIDEADQELMWLGQPLCVTFVVAIPRRGWKSDYALRIVVEVGGVPAGRLGFKLFVSKKASRLPDLNSLPGYEPYRYVFMSYASSDRDCVSGKAMVLSGLGIPYFLDAESLRAGDDWEAKLKEHVRRADLFMLFWSPTAACSKWVEQEVNWALELQNSSPTAEPHIKPYQATSPPTDPPRSLRHVHFEPARP